MRLHRNFLTTGMEVALVLVSTFLLLSIWLLDPLQVQQQRLMQFDQFQRWESPADTSSAVRVVDIDEASLREYGQWPWPRTRLAKLVEQLHDAGAAVIVFDILLAESDRTSPVAIANLWQNDVATAALRSLPDHDEVLSRMLSRRAVVLGSSLSNSEAVKNTVDVANLPFRIISKGAEFSAEQLHGYSGAVWPLPIFRNSASGVGAMNFAPDKDNVVRRVPLLLRLGQQTVPTLIAEALRVAQGARNHLIHGDESGLVDVHIGDITIPTNARGEVWLDFMRAPATPFFPASQILAGTFPVDALRGRIVLVGSSAAQQLG